MHNNKKHLHKIAMHNNTCNKKHLLKIAMHNKKHLHKIAMHNNKKHLHKIAMHHLLLALRGHLLDLSLYSNIDQVSEREDNIWSINKI